jgi:peptidoglycan/LPS O-acetylase OafA/YrhL
MGQAASVAGPDRDYLPQLDGVRTLAIFAVLLWHFFLERQLINQLVHWGRLGVILFFVLSGFLITGILLNARDAVAREARPKSAALKAFYARRMLRIFPIYYLTIFVGALVGFRPIADYLWWHLTYMSNVSWAFFGGDYIGATHLWTLCVEEQFYLFWPLLVLFVPPRRIRAVAIGLVALSLSYKLIGTFCGLGWEATNFTLIGCLDSLGLGALLAVMWHESGADAPAVRRFVRWSLAVALPVLIALQALKFLYGADTKRTILYAPLIDIAASGVFVALVDLAARNTRTALGRFLALGPVRYLGKISYGIYLYHFFLRDLMPRVLRGLGLQPLWPGVALFALYTLISIAVASLSWYAIERPINNLKRYFPYRVR